jgi:hypothetical protein
MTVPGASGVIRTVSPSITRRRLTALRRRKGKAMAKSKRRPMDDEDDGDWKPSKTRIAERAHFGQLIMNEGPPDKSSYQGDQAAARMGREPSAPAFPTTESRRGVEIHKCSRRRNRFCGPEGTNCAAPTSSSTPRARC